MDSLDYFTQYAEQVVDARPGLTPATAMLAYVSVLLLAAMTFAAGGLSMQT